MASFVEVELPKCSICQEGFDRKDVPMSHRAGEQHPFHRDCLQALIDVGNQRDPVYGIQPIKCPVCKVELPRSLPEDPVCNPAPSVQAAGNQLSRSSPSSSPEVSLNVSDEEMQPERRQSTEYWFDRCSLDEQIRLVTADFQRGVISEAAFSAYIADLQARR